MLEVSIRTQDAATVVSPAGDIDRDSAAEFRQAMQAAAEQALTLLLVDMAAVSFLDSAGLAVLVGTHRHLGAGQRLAVCNVPDRMRRVLHDTAMAALMSIHAADEPWPWPQVPQPTARP